MKGLFLISVLFKEELGKENEFALKQKKEIKVLNRAASTLEYDTS